jgi:ferredoxin-NADP reductase
VREIVVETYRVKSLLLQVANWQGHLSGQHVDIRLTAEDGYQAQRSYSIASPPEDELLTLTVERVDNGEVSPYLVDDLRVGDQFDLRGPIGGYFVWTAAMGGPLCLIAGGSGVVPLMAMLRHRERRNGQLSWRTSQGFWLNLDMTRSRSRRNASDLQEDRRHD